MRNAATNTGAKYLRQRNEGIVTLLADTGLRNKELTQLTTEMYLRDGGFQQVRERLNEVDSAVPYNKYHMYSKIILIDFTDPDNVVKEMKTGLQTFVALEESIDGFTRDWRNSH